MRDYRDAKAMARTLRAELAAKGAVISNSESLELIAKSFGLADWNTFSALLENDKAAVSSRENTAPEVDERQAPKIAATRRYGFSAALEATLRRAMESGRQRKQEYITVEHLLLALLDDADAAYVLRACNANAAEIKDRVTAYIDTKLSGIVADGAYDPRPTAAFQRVLQRAMLQADDARGPATGAFVLAALFAEHATFVARTLADLGVARYDVVNLLSPKTRRDSA